jgi:thiol-disulfide isomerase/thioredoxin
VALPHVDPSESVRDAPRNDPNANGLVYFVTVYAPWSASCKEIQPTYEKVAATSSQPRLVTFAQVDTEKQKEVAEAYQVSTIPSFLMLRDGKAIDRVKGEDPSKLKGLVEKLRSEVKNLTSAPAGSSASEASGPMWFGSPLPRHYGDMTDEIEQVRCELLNFDSSAGDVKTLFASGQPSALSGGGGSGAGAKDWVVSDTDEQLMLFVPFRALLKLHTLQVRLASIWELMYGFANAGGWDIDHLNTIGRGQRRRRR